MRKKRKRCLHPAVGSRRAEALRLRKSNEAAIQRSGTAALQNKGRLHVDGGREIIIFNWGGTHLVLKDCVFHAQTGPSMWVKVKVGLEGFVVPK